MPEEKEEKVVDLDESQEEPVEIIVENSEETEETKEQSETENTLEPTSEENSEDEMAQYSEGVQKRIKKLTHKMREAERREKAATEYAQAMKLQADQLASRATQTDTSYLGEYENRLVHEENSLKIQLKEAIESGDVDAQMDLNKKMAQHAIDSEKFKQAKHFNENKTNKSQPAQAQPTQAQPAQQQKSPDPKAEKWAEKNEWFGDDEPMTLTAFSIHNNLVQEGYDPETENYYSELDNRIRKEFPHKFNENTTKNKRPNAVSAPNRGKNVSRNRNSVTLSKSQVAIAKKLGVPLEDYAKQVARLQQQT